MAKSVVDPELEGPVEPQVATRRPSYLPYEISPTPEPVTPPVVIQSSTPFASSVTSEPDAGTGVQIEGLMDNILGEVEVSTAGVSAKQYRSQPTPTPEPAFGRRFPALREIKQRIEQLTEGRPEMTSHSDQVRIPQSELEKQAYETLSPISQSESSNLVSLRRCGVRLLMSLASLDPADFASPVGFFGPSESTPYYPTGDLQRDRGLAHVIAIRRLEELQGNLHGIEDVRIANKLVELAQALNDLGLHDYALNTSGYALDTLEHQPNAAPNSTRLHLASVLSLRANILCDLKRNDEAIRAADRAVGLYREHRDSQTVPVPELAYALLDYAVLLGSVGQKGKAAEVAFELLLGEADETRPDVQDISALCNLCLANARIGDDDDTALSMAEEAIELTLTSSDASSQTVLVGAFLNKSKILSSRGQSEAALSFSDQAVTLLRRISSARPVFSLFLAHALDIHSHNLSDANRKGDAYSIVQEAVMLWQTLKASARGAIARPLAGALFQLAKFRHRGDKRDALREELRIAKSAVDMFREIIPPDVPGLADALYLYADRMLELDKTREAAACAEESIQHFRKAVSEDRKYSLDLIFSLSLASSCLARTERADDAFEYAKQAVEVQHGRKGAKDAQFEAHLA
jgi:tetratricopeptide (TPR) repeat protein